jgi:hypothetical protein
MRSAVTNGRRLFVHGDGNTLWSRRYRDLCAAHVTDMGGPDQLSEAALSLVRRCAAIEVELEAMEGRLSMGQPVDLDVFTRSASHLRRIFETLGFKRVPKDITPGALTYCATAREQPHDGAAETTIPETTTETGGWSPHPLSEIKEIAAAMRKDDPGAANKSDMQLYAKFLALQIVENRKTAERNG